MNLKELLEKREELKKQLRAILNKANEENRSITEEENAEFERVEGEIRDLDNTIRALMATRTLDETNIEGDEGEGGEEPEDPEERDMENFGNYIRGLETRDDPVNMTYGNNGAVVPASIANKIIQRVVDICPVFEMAERYNITGTLTIPYVDEGGLATDIVMEYADEFTEGLSTAAKILSISLTGFLGRAVCDVSKSLINNSNFDIANFVIERMAQAIAKFIEKELLFGTDDKITGMNAGTTQLVTAAAKTAVTSDELIDLQEKVPDTYQGGACWIMNKAVRTAIRKLKDGQGNYLLEKDFESKWGYTLLGKPVYCSDAMPALGTAEKTVIFYGDLTGLAVKVSEDVSIDVLRETKARQHAVEVLGFVEIDAKVQNAQKLAKLVTPADAAQQG